MVDVTLQVEYCKGSARLSLDGNPPSVAEDQIPDRVRRWMRSVGRKDVMIDCEQIKDGPRDAASVLQQGLDRRGEMRIPSGTYLLGDTLRVHSKLERKAKDHE